MQPNQSAAPVPTQETATTTVTPSTPVAPAPVVSQPSIVAANHTDSKVLPILSITFSGIALLLAFIFFISLPLAMAGFIIAIIALIKKSPLKGLSIAGLILSIVATFIALAFITLISFNNLTQRANNAARQNTTTVQSSN
ncbi:MAG: hypothetical protein EOT05_04115 [Candidatus Microsaccharimonas sossegonensis]|uniref:DUF4190 domain-containing protein n=1 Tax=Candidatus Microsaccharimonas sossegonensis TaxID=2506948 RepID=A0A4Q0AI74_9BACT|nr:MAG: hypothetical protein EOT05_04115 [Candidatus Microsaccharimonas sossegonensis]